MEVPEVRLLSVVERSGLYIARVQLRYMGRLLEFSVRNLVKSPYSLSARVEGEYILVDMRDREGRGIATCCIHKGHLEHGLRDECPSLITPPRSDC